MFLNLAITLYFFFLLILLIYSFAYLIASISILFKNKSTALIKMDVKEPIAILVPSYNEGESLVETLKSLINQDYNGEIQIFVLLMDEADSSYPSIINYTKNADWPKNRTIEVVTSGHKEKKININRILPNLKHRYIAFLDADHRADNDWISLSIANLETNKLDAVQSIRRPLALSSFFQVWDSLQNHIGNEVFNHFYQKYHLNTFFTGTTCVFRQDSIENYQFPDSITEDTALSYKLILEGKKIGHNSFSGSYEEVAPDLSSYIARRRRWSQGHTQTFMANFVKIFKSPIAIREKIQLLLHGAYYLLPLMIIIGMNIIGYFYFFQYTSDIKAIILIFTLIVSLLISYFRYHNFRAMLVDSLISWLISFPYISIFAIYLYKFYQQEEYYFIVSFPYLKFIIWLTMAMLLSPMVVFISGKKIAKNPSFPVMLSYLFFYPFVLLIDIFSISLGFVDFVTQNKNWGKVKRSNLVDSNLVPKQIFHDAVKKTKKYRRFSFAYILPLLLMLLVALNDFFTFHNCGDVKYLLGDYIVSAKTPPITSKLTLQQKSIDEKNYHLSIVNVIENPKTIAGDIKIYLDNKRIYEGKINTGDIRLDEYAELGWKTREIRTEIKTKDFSCVQKKKFATSVKELKEDKLYLNGEPFLIKCIIPSFRFSSSNLTVEEGLLQIKNVGANCVRLYHSPTEEFLRAAQKLELLIISQPDETTWENIAIYQNHNVKKLIRRYNKHVRSSEGYPYLLFDHLGNELELNEEFNQSVTNIKKTLQLLQENNDARRPLSYSTYSTYIKYPVDILGINMLDAGEVYWQEAINYTKSLKIPFYASEFGGFIAFYESTPTFLRISRLFKQWGQLLEHGGLGAAFFQSHDNWAQPIPYGHNDPFKNEHPDDNRGFWQNDNTEKAELEALKLIFSDVAYQWVNTKQLRLTNRRDYKLTNIELHLGERQFFIAELRPLETKIFDLAQVDVLPIKMDYQTHRGLKNAHQFNFKAKVGMQLETMSSPLAMRVQQWQEGRWIDFQHNIKDGGDIKLKLTFPPNVVQSHVILVDGLGTDLLKIINASNGRFMFVNVHNYREQVLRLERIFDEIGHTHEIVMEVQRDQIQYLDEKDGHLILIPLRRPQLVQEISL
jgi:cellulose synthase/poly-beta-1,6-N-acetylglucosamine synthase-like glycosyltransferase